MPGLHRLLLNKYYVDEVYDAGVVQPIRIVSQEGLWRGIDVNVIDGAVNGIAAGVVAIGGGLRRLQSGIVRQYAIVAFGGVAALLAQSHPLPLRCPCSLRFLPHAISIQQTYRAPLQKFRRVRQAAGR